MNTLTIKAGGGGSLMEIFATFTKGIAVKFPSKFSSKALKEHANEV